MASIEEIFANLDPKTRKLITRGNEFTLTKIPTPSLGLTRALRGGLVKGSQTLVWGPKSAGKTAFCLMQIAIYQQNGLSCAFMDAEGTYDNVWGSRLGVDNNDLIVSQVRSVNDFVDRSIELMNAGIDLIVLDSITALMPASYLDKGGEIAKMEKTNALGGLARDVSKGLSMLNGANAERKTSLMVISQARMAQKGSMYWGLDSTGGVALKFYSSAVIKLNSSNSTDNTVMGSVQNGNVILQKPVGRKVNWTVEFCKTSPQGYSDDYNLIFDADEVGIDTVSEMIDIGFAAEVLSKTGNYYYYGDIKLGNGKDNSAAFLKKSENKAVFDKIVEEVLNVEPILREENNEEE